MTRFLLWTAAFGCALMTVVMGCRSFTPAVTYYTLSSPLPVQRSTATRPNNLQTLTIAILPVELPGYINRTQMVTRAGPHQLEISSLHRWADYPDRMVQQVLGENLQARLPHARVVSSPSPMGLSPDVTISFHFLELIGTADKKMLLSAVWALSGDGVRLPAQSHRTTFSETMSGTGFEALAAAHGRVLDLLCGEVAETLVTARPGKTDQSGPTN